jgi:predicted deacylase
MNLIEKKQAFTSSACMNTHSVWHLAGHALLPGSRTVLHLPIPGFSSDLPATLPVQVIRAATPGPRLFLTGVVHGDEVIGVEVMHRLLASQVLDHLLCGDVVLIPVVNVFGFVMHSRYLPDRRDLNRSFPGGESGSLAARLAHLLLNEICLHCTHGIDFHSGAVHRFNLPQLRIDFSDETSLALARQFAPPLILHSALRPGSLREVMMRQRIPYLLFEGSEAKRFDDPSAEAGWRGVVRVMQSLGMLPETLEMPNEFWQTQIATSSRWLRAPVSGIFRSRVVPGHTTAPGEILGTLSDFFGNTLAEVCATDQTLVVGMTRVPVVNEGDALFHVASLAG